MFKQAKRQPGDGTAGVERANDGREGFFVAVTNGGVDERIYMSEFNASRIFAMLALMLEIPLPKTVAKEIKL